MDKRSFLFAFAALMGSPIANAATWKSGGGGTATGGLPQWKAISGGSGGPLPGVPSIGQRGYWGGGRGVGNDIVGVDFVTTSTLNPPALLAVSRTDLVGFNSTTNGYFAGGSTGSQTAEIDGMVFATEAGINPGAVLSQARYALAKCNSTVKGYAMCGMAGNRTATVDGLVLATETAFVAATVMPAVRRQNAGMSSPTAGYESGGTNGGGTTQSSIRKMPFATEACATLAAVLNRARDALTGSNDDSANGYFLGGETGGGSNTNDIDRVVFATDTASKIAAVLATARDGLSANHSADYIFTAGGIPSILEIDGLYMPTETSINPINGLTYSTGYMGTVQSGGHY